MIIALQYWAGDEAQALALARLLADLEDERRDNTTLVLARRFDCPLSMEADRTADYCSDSFDVRFIRSSRTETGHPDGCFGLWAGAADALYHMLVAGILPWKTCRHALFIEADGAPVRRDWLDRIIEAHNVSLAQGHRVTGAMMDWPWPHVNGNMVMDLQLVADYPSLMECPSGVAWDLHHGTLLLREARDGHAILNVCGAKYWTPEVLKQVGTQTAWLHGCKDDSVFQYARTLVGRRRS